ncbi:hypothetical protein [Lysobacter capsici]|uniref:hypothetical protein n=1 Tax=Lysobacter capsici TaxID=435897 RepID=UPI00128E4165|nr:hypothetical protein [Lysobacter capsici]
MIRTFTQTARPLSAALLLLVAGGAWAYKLSTHSSEEERRLSGITASTWSMVQREAARLSISTFTEPVHEEITNRSYGCNAACDGSEALNAPAAVLAGVRWNDDPPFAMTANQARGIRCNTRETIRFETQPVCWVGLFLDANKGAAAGKRYGPGDAMLYRTHFGDLQFLHAMAARNGEPAFVTKERIMGWSEFAWRASLGEYTLDTRLKEIQIPVIQASFGRTQWRILDLYTQGAGGGLRRMYQDVAFGSLLHTLQDSYAAGHAQREESSGVRECPLATGAVPAPGAIAEFHAYNQQDHDLHAHADTGAAFARYLSDPGNSVDIGRALVKARDRKLAWNEVQPFFDCVFTLQRSDAPASPGDQFEGSGVASSN